MKTAALRWGTLLAAFVGFVVAWSAARVPEVVPASLKPLSPPASPPGDFESFARAQVEAGVKAGVPEPFLPRLVRRQPGRSPLAILYIHGFGASRGEGEAVVEALAGPRLANTYYLRLPGHGESLEAHAATPFQAYLDASAAALERMSDLGEKVVIVGSSTGGLLATWLAGTYPERVAGLILASPFYDFVDPTAFVLNVPGGIHLIEAAYGEIRDASWKTDPEHRLQAGYDDHWMTRQRFEALVPLARLRLVAARPEIFERVVAPTLMMYYYQDDSHQDETTSVEAMRDAFALLGQGSTPHPHNRQVAIPDGNHILLSAFVRTDKTLILQSCDAFLTALGFAPAPPLEPAPH